VALRLLNVRANISSGLAYFTNCLEVNLKPTKTSISEHCNDASLNLRKIRLQHQSIYPDNMSQKDKSAISGAVTACVQFLKNIVLSIKSKTLVPINRTREDRGLFIQKDMANLPFRQFHHGTPGHSEFARILPDFLKALNFRSNRRQNKRINLAWARFPRPSWNLQLGTCRATNPFND
jgi:hypothetical protein